MERWAGSFPAAASFISNLNTKNKMENFYNFCGTFDKQLKADYIKNNIKKQGITFPQFCIVVYSNTVDEIKSGK